MKSAPKPTSSDVLVVSSVTGASATSTPNFCRYCKEVGHTISDCSQIKAKEAKKASLSVQSVANGTQSGNQPTQCDETADVALICLLDDEVSSLFPRASNQVNDTGNNHHPTYFDSHPYDLFKRYTRVMLCDYCVTIGESNPGIYKDMELPRNSPVGQCCACGEIGPLGDEHEGCVVDPPKMPSGYGFRICYGRSVGY